MPFTQEAAEFLRPLLNTEQDPHALRTVIAAFTSYCSAEEVRAILVHADHTDPGVRHCVASGLASYYRFVTADHPDVVATLLRLAEDPLPETRVTALYAFTRSPIDAPELRGVLAAHLADQHLDARIEAAAALALRDDERGLSALDEIRCGIKNHRSPGAGRLNDINHLLRA
ncbi:HEAT repeat domain-containing protein [Streptomyces orinoci]|uniref:HEAT repeat domain-containing protein n=1 Tax=Streptomyces orinoci TaxID=67339 RepID=A0ABV3JT89_STRON|nr:HEAT repeat domain-containing protein [Streptomyces orinoci]